MSVVHQNKIHPHGTQKKKPNNKQTKQTPTKTNKKTCMHA